MLTVILNSLNFFLHRSPRFRKCQIFCRGGLFFRRQNWYCFEVPQSENCIYFFNFFLFFFYFFFRDQEGGMTDPIDWR